MKKTLFIVFAITAVFLLVLTCISAYAQQVTLAWDAVTPAPTGYRLYARQSATYNYTTPAWEGTATTCTVTVPDNVQSAFVVRAYVRGSINGQITESGSSNEAVVNAKNPPTPTNLIIQAIDQIIQGLMDIKKALLPAS